MNHRRNIDPEAPFRAITRARMAQQPATLDRDQVRDLGIQYHSAMESLRSGRGTVYDIESLVNVANIALLLCEYGLGAEWIDVVKVGQQAIVRTAERGWPTQHFIFSGPDYQAVTAMLEFHDRQLESPDCTDKLVMQAIQDISRRRRAGQVLRVA